jgi:hypothetical protein
MLGVIADERHVGLRYAATRAAIGTFARHGGIASFDLTGWPRSCARIARPSTCPLGNGQPEPNQFIHKAL